MAVVIDEHGGTAGVVTLEDLFEEVVGEIEEGPGTAGRSYRDREGRLRVPGTMRIDEVGQEFDLELEHEEVDSVSGLVLMLLGRPPVVGDSVRFGRLLFEVTAVKGHGVEECAVSLLTDVDAGPSEGVGLGLAQHFARDRRRVALAEGQELQQVGDRVAFRPAEVGVRDLAGPVADVQQQRRDRVGNRRAHAAQHAVAIRRSTPRDPQHSLNSETSPGRTSTNSTASSGVR